MKLPYYKSLDGLRGIAAMLVVIFHFYSYPNGYYSTDDYSVYKKITEIGQHGVSLFFVLSGFVITRILIHGKTDNHYFASFFLKRILRIAPLYYMFLIIWFGVLPLIIQVASVPLSNQLPYYFYLQNVFSTFGVPLNGPPHFWSLAVEEHFYMMWPFAVFYIPTKHLGKVIGASVCLILLLKCIMIQNKLPIHDFTLTRMDQILMGSYLALLELKGYFKPQSVRYYLKLAFLVIPLALILHILGSHFHFAKELFKYSLLGIVFASFLAVVLSLKSTSIVNRLLAIRALQYLGRISYGIYVWHVIALIFLQFFFLTKTMFVDILITVGLTLLFAHISYFYFESHFIRLKNFPVSAIRPRLSHTKSVSGLLQTFTRSWRI
jgi:peptidoglycan/LPS O-acetylase OafA/YrhL